MKKSFIIVFGIALLMSCNSRNNTNSADNADSTSMGAVSENNNANNNTWDQDRISKFVSDVSAGGMMEVELGKVAQQKALSQQVKDFGKMMEKDHSDANNKLKTAVQSLGLNVPAELDKDHKDKIDNMNKKAGKEFDKDYIDNMVSDHKDDIDEFEDAQKNLPAGELKTWVDNTLPVLRQHLIQAQTVQDQLKNNK